MAPEPHHHSRTAPADPQGGAVPVEQASTVDPATLAAATTESTSPFEGVKPPKNPVTEIFERALDVMHPGPLYLTVQKRLAELSNPLPLDLPKRISDAIDRFDTFSTEKKVQILNAFISSQLLMDRASWPLSSAPAFGVGPEEQQEAVERTLTLVARHILQKGTLPKAACDGVWSHLKHRLPPDHSRVHKLMAIGGAVLGVAGLLTTPWIAWVPVCVTAYMLIRPCLMGPPVYPGLMQGFLKEQVEAAFQVQSGIACPLQYSLLQSFTDPSTPGRIFGKTTEIEGFLTARTLRVLGWSQRDISALFVDSSSLRHPYAPLRYAVTEALGSHGHHLSGVLAQALDKLDDKQIANTFDFLDTMTVAHFAWAQRDRVNIAGDFADFVLASPNSVEPVAA